ncbi:hypothetical protein MYAM1_004017 [Malassezia yamatoensis]|uniref:Protein-tyrosine-phosphatase n=1 Tax=Malassezia yamatoensis TaxID=253288 RepID=A0AAJ5YVQ1_9BASI|nr:hypothetical protein MYAM1_004017 [Malassezia yamatoensis]
MGRVPLAPPMRFGTVAFPPPWIEHERIEEESCDAHLSSYSQCLYRGAYPKLRNLPFLATLHLRTIVSLTPKPLESDAGFAEWASKQNNGQGIRMVHVRTEKPKEDTGGLTREGAARAMLELLHKENLPLYVHCLDGVEATSTLIACLRKIQGWSDPSIRMEFARDILIAPNRLANSPYGIPKHLIHFLDHYGEPDGVHLPPQHCVPSWVWPTLVLDRENRENHRLLNAAFRHPSLRIQFQRSKSQEARSSKDAAFSSRSVSGGKVWSRSPRRITRSSVGIPLPLFSDNTDGASETLSETTDKAHSDGGHAQDSLRGGMRPSSADLSDTTEPDPPRLYPVSTSNSVSTPATQHDQQNALSSQASTPLAQPAEAYKPLANEIPAWDLQRSGTHLHHEPHPLSDRPLDSIAQRTSVDSESDTVQKTEFSPELSQRSREPNAGDASETQSQLYQLKQEEDQHLVEDDDLDDEFHEEDEEFQDEEEDPSQVLDALDLEGY